MSKNITKANRERFRLLQEIGCIACIQWADEHGTPVDVHHVLDGGRRIGHDATVGLCPWHHRGVWNGCASREAAIRAKGPSMASDPRQFAEHFGTQVELLELQNKLIAAHKGDSR